MNLGEMRRLQKDKEDDPFTAQKYQHAHALEDGDGFIVM